MGLFDAKCTQCGEKVPFLSIDMVTGACRKCQANGARATSLGCGTLILIALIVLIFSNAGSGNLGSEVKGLSSEVGELKKAIEAQTAQIKMLQEKIEKVK